MKPSYYEIELPDGNSFEVRQLIEALGHGEGFYIGCAIKHLLRAGRKPGQPAVHDLMKTRDYVDFELERLQRVEVAAEATAAADELAQRSAERRERRARRPASWRVWALANDLAAMLERVPDTERERLEELLGEVEQLHEDMARQEQQQAAE